MFNFQELTFLLGPNGAGKSTLLKGLARLAPQKQLCFLEPALQSSIKTPEQFIYLPAKSQIQFGVTGGDLFELFETKASPYFSAEILEQLNVTDLLDKPLNELSSGEAQRVCLAATLSHRSNCVLLDEPLTHLDWSYGFKLEKIISNMLRLRRGFVISSHDLNWALLFKNSRALVLSKGRVINDAPIEVALTHSKVQEVFNFKSQLIPNPLNHASILALGPSNGATSYEQHRT